MTTNRQTPASGPRAAPAPTQSFVPAGTPDAVTADSETASTAATRGRAGRGLAFLSAALRNPKMVGTAMPTGRYVARRLGAVIPDGRRMPRRPVVLEIGAGTGSITAELAAATGGSANLIAIEKDPELAAVLRSRQLGVDVVVADAAEAPRILAERDIAAADAVISALPWTLIPAQQQRELLHVLSSVLRPTGAFTTVMYAYAQWVPAARRFREELTVTFDEVLPTRTVWRNAPPALTYVCRRPVLK